MGAEIVEDWHDVALASASPRTEELFDIGVEALAVDGPAVETEQGALMRSLRKAARKVAASSPLAPAQDLVDEALSPLVSPSRAGEVILVLVQVSSMKTSRLGSMSP